MAEIKVHVDANAKVTIPEWLLRKMGMSVTEEETEEGHGPVNETDSEKRREAKAALDRLAAALRNAGVADVTFVDCGDVIRSESRS